MIHQWENIIQLKLNKMKGRTPKGSTRTYDKNGKFIGFTFRNVFDKIEYELRNNKLKIKKNEKSG